MGPQVIIGCSQYIATYSNANKKMATGSKENDKGLYKTRVTALESPLSTQLTADVRALTVDVMP